MGINLALAYASAGVASLIGFTIADIIDHPPIGPGILGNWAYGMGWLLFAAPFVLFVLICLDLVLYWAQPQRRLAMAVSLAPAGMMAIVMLAEPAFFSIAAWLAATGIIFGLTMRLPPTVTNPR